MSSYGKAIQTLEFDKITSLLADCAATDGARDMALALTPDYEPERIRRKLRQTTDAKKLLAVKGSPSFGGIHAIADALERAEKGASLAPRELLDIAAVLHTARLLISYRDGGHTQENTVGTLAEFFSRLLVDRALEDRITRTILAEDMIADEASPALADIRRKIRATQNKVKDILQKYTSGAFSKSLQENIVTMRGGRYVIPVRAECKGDVKGLVHDTSASGATLFIEPLAVVEANNEMRELQSKEQHEIDRILAELSALCASVSGILSQDYHLITELAFIFAKAELSYRMKGMEPTLSENHSLSLVSARHPLIDPKKVVPTTVSLGKTYDTLVITGPNTGGKTVTLKTIGLFALMAQAGLHLPTDGDSEICVFDSILADIGDEQSIEQSLSTFSSHMVNIAEILRIADENSLILLDELGAGTDPTEGASLAVSILEELRSRGARCAATTHYAELKVWALDTEGVSNASCEFDLETLRPTYRLIIGTPGKSNAFAISEKLGIDKAILQKAKERISSDDKRFEVVIEKLEQSRIEMERERDEAIRNRREWEAKRDEEEKKLNEKIRQTEKELEKTRAQAVSMIESARVTSDFVMEELEKVKKEKEAAAMASALDDARRSVKRRLKQAGDEINPVFDPSESEDYEPPRAFRSGDTVRIASLNLTGTLASDPDKDGNVTVCAGLVRTKTNVKNLRLVEEAVTVTDAQKKKTAAASYKAIVDRNFSPSLDLRGQIGDDAWFMTDKYLDEAKVARVPSVTLIHGKGTGALRNILHKYLRDDPRVKSFRLGQYGEGDTGVTIVEIR